MPRLHLKRTPAEEERHASKKARKAARKEREQSSRYSGCNHLDNSDSRRRRSRRSRSKSPKRESRHRSERKKKHHHDHYSREPSNGEPGSSSYAHRTRNDDADFNDHLDFDDSEDSFDKDRIDDFRDDSHERPEQDRFAEKMRDALEDDGLYDPTQRLDGVEARLNTYSHIPRRWRGTDEGFSAGMWMEDAREEIDLEPWQMNDDEYAEYMRAGMWRKKNQAEYQAQLRKKEERKLRQERSRRLLEETRRLEKESQAERQMRAAAKAKRRMEEARRLYDERWNALLSRTVDVDVVVDAEDGVSLSFEDIPWPVPPPPPLPPPRSSSKTSEPKLSPRDPADFTKEAISSFLLQASSSKGDPPPPRPEDGNPTPTLTPTPMPSTKEILRSTMLRFHPDKFEARVLARVKQEDRELVKDVANMIVRILNELLKETRV